MAIKISGSITIEGLEGLFGGGGGNGGNGGGTTDPLPPLTSLPTTPIFPALAWYTGKVGAATTLHAQSTALLQKSGEKLDTASGLLRPLQPDLGSVFNGAPFGFPYNLVRKDCPKVQPVFTYADECDPGPYPIPANPKIEAGSDRHLICIDTDNWLLYEIFAYSFDGTTHRGGSGAVWNLTTGKRQSQEQGKDIKGWTSADAAGLPIFPLLVRGDEVLDKKLISHPLRVTVPRTRRAYVPPGTHWASTNTDPGLLPMGARIILRPDYNITTQPNGQPWPPECTVILQAMKDYGAYVADNGLAFFFQGTPDPRYDNDRLGLIKQIKGSDLRVLNWEGLVTP